MQHSFEEDLRAHAPLPESGVASRTILNTPELRLVQFVFAPGRGLQPHAAPGPITLYFIQGQAVVQAGEETVRVRERSLVTMPAGMTHAITAESEVVMLLTLVKSPATSDGA